MTPGKLPAALEGPTTFLDDRLGTQAFLRRNMRKVFPDHWSFMLGEITLYSFVILLVTGVFLTLWFQPSMNEAVYHGSYAKLDGVPMSQAYESTLRISFDVRGGLLIRQIHHWAAIVFIASMMLHLLRVLFTGAYRRPRELNWLIGLTMLALSMIEGLFGYSLPDDLLSGAGLRVTQGLIQSGIPIVGTWVSFFLFGGEFPGDDILPRLFVIHVLLLPGIFLALITAHMMIMWHQKHTQMPGLGRTDSNVVGYRFSPVFMAKTGAFFLFTCGVLAAMGTLAQINPVWLYGPYDPSAATAGPQPDFYMGFAEGALRLMPNWETTLWGHTISWNVTVPFLGSMGLVFTALGLWPWVERWATGDRTLHHVNDRPRDAPTRTALGMAGVSFYGLLWLAGGNDVIATHFHLSLYATIWFFRFAVLAGPIVAYTLTRRICLGLRRADTASLEHGYETGVIVMTAEGGFREIHRPVSREERAVLASSRPLPPEPAEATRNP